MTEAIIIPGKYKKHDVMAYTISTCMWCRLFKNKLRKNEIEFSYIDIDLISYDEKQKIKNYLRNYKSRLAFPMMFVDDEFIPNSEIDAKIEKLKMDG